MTSFRPTDRPIDRSTDRPTDRPTDDCLSKVWVGGGPVGVSSTRGGGYAWHTTDGGETWAREAVPGGYVFGLAVHAPSGAVVAAVEGVLTSTAQVVMRSPPPPTTAPPADAAAAAATVASSNGNRMST